MDNLRVSELAKELGMTSKEIIEKFSEIDIVVKSHSNTVTPTQIKKLKEHLGLPISKSSSKPKAFIVKKAKTSSSEEKELTEKVVEKKAAQTPKIERIQRIEKVEKKVFEPEKKPEEKPEVKQEVKTVEAPIIKKAEKPAIRIERTKIEYPKNQSRIEIVRKAPPKQSIDNARTNSSSQDDNSKKPFNKGGDKKLVERRIIPQEIYDSKNGPSSRKRNDGKKKEKDYNSKKEDQEMISLEKAAAQKHKKKVHKEEAVEEVKSLVVNEAMTIQELADKI